MKHLLGPRLRVRLALLLATLVLAGCTGTRDPPDSLPTPTYEAIRPLEDGQHSRFQDRLIEVVDAEPRWREVWTAHAGQAASPTVDLATERVVVIFVGARPNICHDMQSNVSIGDGELVVRVEEWGPSPQQACGQLVVQPYSFTAIPAGWPVRFEGAEPTRG